jgi:hypothetical protein
MKLFRKKRYQRIAAFSTKLLERCLDADLLYRSESEGRSGSGSDDVGVEEEYVPF